MGLQEQHRVTVYVDGVRCGVFDKRAGGGVDSTEQKYKPGGMAPEVTLGGSQTVPNVTLTRLFDRQRDLELVRWLMTRCGRGAATCSDQYLDADGNPYGSPYIYTGILKSVKPGDADSNSNNADLYELEISTEGTVG